MARVRKDGPEAEMQALHERRMELATLRHSTDAASAAAQAVLDGLVARRQAAISAEIDGVEAAETVAQVDQAARAAAATIADCRERAEVIRRKEGELKEAADAVIDGHPGFYEQKRREAIEEAERLTRAAGDAVRAAEAGYMAAGAASNVVWQSYKRRELDGGPREWPANDLGGASSEIGKALGLLARLKGRPEDEQRQSRTSLSVPAVRGQLQGPASEPLIEVI
jgi:hypothetical protein